MGKNHRNPVGAFGEMDGGEGGFTLYSVLSWTRRIFSLYTCVLGRKLTRSAVGRGAESHGASGPDLGFLRGPLSPLLGTPALTRKALHLDLLWFSVWKHGPCCLTTSTSPFLPNCPAEALPLPLPVGCQLPDGVPLPPRGARASWCSRDGGWGKVRAASSPKRAGKRRYFKILFLCNILIFKENVNEGCLSGAISWFLLFSSVTPSIFKIKNICLEKSTIITLIRRGSLKTKHIPTSEWRLHGKEGSGLSGAFQGADHDPGTGRWGDMRRIQGTIGFWS